MSFQEESKYLRSAASLLAYAVSDLYPTAQIVGVEVSEVDFVCDFVFEQKPSLDLIAERMRAAIKADLSIEPLDMMRENGVEFLRHHGQTLLADRLESFEKNIVPLVKIEEFTHFSPGKQLASVGEIGAFSLLGMELGEVTRIRGVAFSGKGQLKKFLKKVEEARKCDPIRLGRELRLFTFDEGKCLWHPNGFAVREALRQFWVREHKKQKFSFVAGESHDAIYQSFERDESQLPCCMAQSGELDRETIFCTLDQLLGELISSLQFIVETVRIFGFQYRLYFIDGNDSGAGWKKSVVKSLEGFDYEREQSGEGPKVEVRIFDTLGRAWKGPCIEVALAEKLVYKGYDGKDHQPMVISRSTFGSIERFVTLLTEQFAGRFPFWLAPEQLRVIPVTEKQWVYAEAIGKRLADSGYRVTVDTRGKRLNAKVHEAQVQRIPKLIIVGEREEDKGSVALREGAVTRDVTIDDLLQGLQQEDEENLFKR